MAETVNLFISKGIVHELKEMERDALSVTPKQTHVVIELGDTNIMGQW